ncbi:expressed unknown protein [Seminavis robusta]|uniref:Uncharacterized protein n=1 Tax=Seminavis robusta TaxID=568900 RepID=A0A9N8E047_9STRA|nr:expressed unknown protein [Seminavis robusta]|eukprot:Sro487_g152840.1 n/a (392) ;mRNA; f:23188-24655
MVQTRLVLLLSAPLLLVLKSGSALVSRHSSCLLRRSGIRSARPRLSLVSQDEDALSEACLDNESSRHGLQPFSRRAIFQRVGILSFVLGNPLLANAAAPVTIEEADSFGAKAQRLLRPKPPKALRPKLNKDFAVLLMRSSYMALDQLDCVAMDQFQRDFFLIRQAEYQFYVNELGPGIVQQGDLTDPYYFDFISFAQYATISREILQNPAVVFNEQKPIEVPEDEPQRFETVVIKRDPALTNDKLASTHSQLVALAILNKLDETFGTTDARIPKVDPQSRPSADAVLASVSQLVKLFLINGYAWDGKASISKNSAAVDGDASGTQISINLTAPANIWSGQALQLRNKLGGGVSNSFILTCANELVRRMGYEIAATSVSYTGTNEICTFTLS